MENFALSKYEKLAIVGRKTIGLLRDVRKAQKNSRRLEARNSNMDVKPANDVGRGLPSPRSEERGDSQVRNYGLRARSTSWGGYVVEGKSQITVK